MTKRWMRTTAAVLSLILVVSPIGTNMTYAEPIVVEESDIEVLENVGLEDTVSEDIVSENVVSDLDGRVIPLTNYIDDGLTEPAVGDSAEQLVGAVLPSSYRATEQERADLTSVRDQNLYGTCWTFGSLASGEQTYMKNSSNQTTANTDLSELQLAWFSYNDDTSTPYGDISQDITRVNFTTPLSEADKANAIYNMGGNTITAAFTLARGIGAASEIEEPYLAYNNIVDNDPYGLEASYAYKASASLRDLYAINIKADPELAKQMILDYGAITAAYYHSDEFYSYSNVQMNYYKDKSFCDNISDSVNHAVAIVGWDDNYGVENFLGSVKPTKAGAWLVRNSWGDDWGDDGGYFWMSYESQSLSDHYVLNMEPVDAEERTYQYDGVAAPYITGIANGGSVCNVFTAAGTAETNQCEVVDSVSFGVWDSNVDYSIQIYKNPTSESNPASGTKMLSSPLTGTFLMAGYYTIDLPKPVRVKANDKFAVVFTLTGQNSNVRYMSDGNSSRYVYLAKSGVSSVVGTCEQISHIEQGQSYYKYLATSAWGDLAGTTIYNCTPRIKAFTHLVDYIADTAVSINQTALQLEVNEKVVLSANVIPANATDQEIFWSSSNEAIAEVATDGTVTGKKVGNVVITATSAGGHQATCEVTVAGAKATVHFETFDGDEIADRKYAVGESFGELPIPVYEGYDFKGWYLDALCTSSKRVTESSVVPEQSELTLYAKWKAIPYTILFDAGNGQEPETVYYEAEDTFGSMPEPEYGYRTFGGWYTEPNGQGTRLTEDTKVSTVARKTTVYAYWMFVPCESVNCIRSISLNISEKLVNSVVLSPENATCAGITYRSLDTGIFTIDQNGRITGRKGGSAEGVVLATVLDVAGNTVVKECRFEVTVIDKTITIEAITTQRTAQIGDAVDKSAITVYACSQFDRNMVSQNQFTISPDVITVQGDNCITISCQDFTTEVNIVGVEGAASEETSQNYAPRMQQKTVVVNRNLESQGNFIMEPSVGIERMVVAGSFYIKSGDDYTQQSGLTIANTVGHEYEITVDDSCKNGKKKLYVKADVTAKGVTTTYYVPITVNVVSKVPTIKLKTSAMNVFYTDEENRTTPLTITNKSGVTIKEILLDDEMSQWFQVEENAETGGYEVIYRPKTEVTAVKNIVKKGKAVIRIEGYSEPVTATLSVSVKMKAPSIKSLESPAVLNLSQSSSYDKPIYIVDNSGAEQSIVSVKLENEAFGEYFRAVTVSEGNIVLAANENAKECFAKAKTIKLNVSAQNWLYERPVSVKFCMTESNPTAKLSAKQITFNCSYQGAKASTYLNFDTDLGEDGYLLDASSIDCTGGDTATAPVISVKECSNTRYRLISSATNSTKAGTYTYTVIPKTAEGRELSSLKLKVKVTENKKQPQLVLKTVKSSKFDVLLGEDAEISYTMTCKNIDAKVMSVSISETDSVFEAKLERNADGQQIVRIGLKENAEVAAKQTCVIPMSFVIRDVGGMRQSIQSTVKFKTVEGSLKFTMPVTTAQLSKGVAGSCVEQIAVITSPEDAEFASLKNVSTGIPEGAFYVFTSPATGKVRIVLRDSSKVSVGKTYTFKFAATAGYGTKTATQKVKITITD